jgi:predicted benzoate:H+ symporter BenE
VTLLVILLYFLASAFIVLGFMMLFVYRRTRHPALLLLSFVYSGAGLVAGYSTQWWPLLAGFVVAWLLKLAGYDVDGPGRRRTRSAQSPDSDPPRDSP